MLTFDTLESVGIKMYVEKKRKIDFNNEALEIIQSNSFYLFICIHSFYMENTHIVMKRKFKAERFKMILFFIFSINDKYLYSPRFL
jgi:hypothetical protein